MKMHPLWWAAALVAMPALGQSPRLTDAKATGAVLSYQSAFADYRGWREPDAMNWRQANDEVGAMGGHMGHLRGGASPKAVPGAATKPAAKNEAPK